ncbi:MAG: DUF455 family protein [Verrucomicrobiales bacterium]|nr:DUF455 family protein [Verrucomicrobiales bacterium]
MLPPSTKQAPTTESPVEYAERVLFSESLAEKLRFPESLDFDLEDSNQAARDLYQIEPGRPEELRFADANETRPAMPAAPALVDERSRGVLLHFFANHELLAAELMALAILRFRNAPTAFLRGLANTLKEEQRHTGWYVNRMKQCGVTFGEYPVNRFFWDSVSTMECPVDYVSRLSLTFEQANLDYSKHYAGILKNAGDIPSSKILTQIYKDEISHVGYGLRWFRQWKAESDSDWDALEKRLVFPLSPIRAKGNQIPFNIEGRRAAGFDDDYIQKLSLYERSRGRTPNVFYFNPEAENRAAVSPAVYHPPAKIQAVVDDLESLVLFLAKRDDLVLMRNVPSPTHRLRLSGAGFHLPEIEGLGSNGLLKSDSILHQRKIHRFLPWSKAPNLKADFHSFSENEANGTDHWKWHDKDRSMFSKSAQAKALSPWFGESFAVQNRDDLEGAIEAFRSKGIDRIILKQSFATAGSGMRRLSFSDLESLLARGFTEVPSKGGGILLEPCHARIFDFSIQFEIENGRARRVSTVEQLIAPSGGYRGTVAMQKFCQGLDPAIARFLMNEALPQYDEGSAFITDLEKWASQFNFSGALGVDAYLYRDDEGKLSHRTACEINPRYTMGRVAHELRKQIAPGYGLLLKMVKTAELEKSDPTVELKNGQLCGGSLLLTEPQSNSHFAALIHVAKHRSHLRLS